MGRQGRLNEEKGEKEMEGARKKGKREEGEGRKAG